MWRASSQSMEPLVAPPQATLIPSSSRDCNRRYVERGLRCWAFQSSFCAMLDDLLTTNELLHAWRDATRAAELARRLAEVAETLAETAAFDAAAVEEVAALAETTAKAAEAAAVKARGTADRMLSVAETARSRGREDAAAAVTDAGDKESFARDRYQEAERVARTGQDPARPTQLRKLPATDG